MHDSVLVPRCSTNVIDWKQIELSEPGLVLQPLYGVFAFGTFGVYTLDLSVKDVYISTEPQLYAPFD